ncbi:hypothetical protein BJ508DRAFT_301919 [Ascobolus immersus RN42]|uniref:Chaperone/heat shock protein Hsp12 n=1 Tax=Ascobolus immersus RN42 TaxID=1160509 RepID=A0A3N4IMB6_ASCIM|nr:hypothetical protein BJ508DRAFT_301919 [Ascobolus immersus RN42]
MYSDSIRKDFSTEAKETAQPDFTKSKLDKAGEAITDVADRAAGHIEPNSEKSTSQEVHDKARETTDEHTEGGKSETLLEKGKKAVGLDDSEDKQSVAEKVKAAVGLGEKKDSSKVEVTAEKHTE